MTAKRDRPSGSLRQLDGNPLWAAFQEHRRSKRLSVADRDALRATYAFGIPTDKALQFLSNSCATGVVEVGAGTGYWARTLHDHGLDVIAYDLAPPPSSANRWFAGRMPWYPVLEGNETVADAHSGRTLLLVWPSRNQDWAARAVERYYQAGGHQVVYVGEGPGGRTGDDSLHAMLGYYDRCWTCAYRLVDAPCVCGIPTRWRCIKRLPLPNWWDTEDDLRLFESV
jgi:hypothetical protein